MIAAGEAARRQALQLHLDLAESPAPAAVLWELLPEAERGAALALLAALIAQAVAGGEADRE